MHVSKITFHLIFQKDKNKVLSTELNSQHGKILSWLPWQFHSCMWFPLNLAWWHLGWVMKWREGVMVLSALKITTIIRSVLFCSFFSLLFFLSFAQSWCFLFYIANRKTKVKNSRGYSHSQCPGHWSIGLHF